MSNKAYDKEIKKEPAIHGTYMGKPIIQLPLIEGSNIKFRFGLQKARLILDYLPEIKAFVEKHDEE